MQRTSLTLQCVTVSQELVMTVILPMFTDYNKHAVVGTLSMPV